MMTFADLFSSALFTEIDKIQESMLNYEAAEQSTECFREELHASQKETRHLLFGYIKSEKQVSHVSMNSIRSHGRFVPYGL